jgi:perosamine synthetase
VIPVFEPYVGEDEVAAVAAAVKRGEISGTFGDEIPAFEQEFAEYAGAKHGIAVTSGTTALQLAVAAAGVGEGDEVLVPASTNVATALAAYHCGAVPVPIDSEPRTGNLDVNLVESLITPRTRAIIPVHLFGHPVDMDRLLEIARAHGLIVIEDCAESHGATVRTRVTGSLGDMGCFSFYANKVITTGEGGMVVTSDDRYAERLRSLRNLAFGTPRFVHQEAGFNFRMTGYQAAMGRVQLGKIDQVIDRKRQVARIYSHHLSDIPSIMRPLEEPWARSVYWMYVIVLDDDFPLSRDELIFAMREKGVDCRTHFYPMNLQPFLQRMQGFRSRECPIAERLWERGLYLPSSITLTEEQIETVAAALRSAAF